MRRNRLGRRSKHIRNNKLGPTSGGMNRRKAEIGAK